MQVLTRAVTLREANYMLAFVARYESRTVRMTSTTFIGWVTFEHGKASDHVAVLDLLLKENLDPCSTQESRGPLFYLTQYTIEFPTGDLNRVRGLVGDLSDPV